MEDKIKDFWKSIDKELKKFNGRFKYDIKQRITRIIREFNITRDNLYEYMSKDDLSMFKSELQDSLDDNMSDYLKYRIDKMLGRTKIKYWEALQILINIAYFQVLNNASKLEDEIINNTMIITNKFYQQESYEVLNQKQDFHLIPLPNYLLPHLMSTPLYLGYNWLEYKQSLADTNANKTYRKIVVGIAQSSFDEKNETIMKTYEHSFEIERKRYVSALDNEIASLSSQVAMWGMEKQGVKKVMFVAVMDDKTTNICQSMDRQVFKVDDWNTYYRYERNNDEKMSKYTTYGLKIGENQPALHYNCRSVLYPIR